MSDMAASESVLNSPSCGVTLSMPSISLVIPTLNEAENFKHVLRTEG